MFGSFEIFMFIEANFKKTNTTLNQKSYTEHCLTVMSFFGTLNIYDFAPEQVFFFRTFRKNISGSSIKLEEKK